MSYFDFFDHEYLSNLHGKKNLELFAVYYFLLNESDKPIHKDKFLVNPVEPSDIVYGDRKFQITTASADADAVLGKLKKKETAQEENVSGEWVKFGETRARMLHATFDLKEGLENHVLRPVQSKINQYGGKRNASLKDIVLIIFSYNSVIVPYESMFWKSFVDSNKNFFESSGFKAIFWTDQKVNIPIYPINGH